MHHQLGYILCFFLEFLLISLSTGTTFQNLGNYCWNTPTYSPNITYQSQNKSSTVGGGDGANATVYELFTCRDDASAGSCGRCVSDDLNTTQLGLCPKEQTDIIWYDYCILRYSNGSADQLVRLTSQNGSRTTGDVSFPQVVGNTLEQMTTQVTGERFAAQEANSTASNPRIYTLGLCTPDLSDDNDYMNGVSAEESSQYDLAMIKAITSDFSLKCKIGQGGYGSVYKAWEYWRDDTPLEILDPVLAESYNVNEVIQCIHISLLCVQEVAVERPTMAEVMLMLSSYSSNRWSAPREPAFYHGGREGILKESESEKSASINEVSISELHPR
nr:putative receptor-like protein kinase At4g00960 [Ipomoea batatas]